MKYSKFWSVLLELFIERKPLISEECNYTSRTTVPQFLNRVYLQFSLHDQGMYLHHSYSYLDFSAVVCPICRQTSAEVKWYTQHCCHGTYVVSKTWKINVRSNSLEPSQIASTSFTSHQLYGMGLPFCSPLKLYWSHLA